MAAAFLRSDRGKTLMKRVQAAIFVCVAAYLFFQLQQIGWKRLWASLPRTPWFYLIFLLIYAALPIAETLVYRISWKFGFREGLPVFLKKRVYNKDVLGYSGEVYLYLWARRTLGLPDRRILSTIKDNTILSSASSTLVAISLLAGFFFAGQIALIDRAHELLYLGVALGAVGLLATLGITFRRAIFSIPGRAMMLVVGIHVSRLLLINTLQVTQWSVVSPEVSLQVWFTFLSLQLIMSRIPLVPGKDLLFVGASVGLSHFMEISSASVAGMLLASSMLDKVTNLISFSVTSLLYGRAGRPAGNDPGRAPAVGERIFSPAPVPDPVS